MELEAVSEAQLVARQQLLDEVNDLLTRCQADVTRILDELEWTPDHFIQPKKQVQCPYDSGHMMPAPKLEQHKRHCDLRQKGVSAEDAEVILDNSSFFYEKATCVHSVKLDKETINSALWNYHVKNHSVYYGHDTMPLTPNQESQLLSREDRLGLAEYVISKAREANRLAQLEKDELMASANLADLIKEDKDEKRPLDHIEELAAMRDYRRRRQTYRAKNVHITKKSHTEIMREVINNQMEMFAQSLKDQQDTGELAQDAMRDIDSKSGIQDSVVKSSTEDRSAEEQGKYERHPAERYEGNKSYRRRDRERRVDSERRNRDRDRERDKRDKEDRKERGSSKRGRSRSRSRTKESTETDDSRHSSKHRKKHKHKHKHKKDKSRNRSDSDEV